MIFKGTSYFIHPTDVYCFPHSLSDIICGFLPVEIKGIVGMSDTC